MNDNLYAIWLLINLGVNSKNYLPLCKAFNSFYEIYCAEEEKLKEIEGISKKCIEKLQDKNTDKAQEVLEYCLKNTIDITTFYGVKYPTVLKNISVPPIVLFSKGQLPDWENEISVAVVGSRKPSVYGNTMAGKIAEDLAREGVVVISGMARGIDTSAHKGALKGNGKTVAVLGCGVDVVYPPESTAIKGMIEEKGVVISEFLPGTPPLPNYFPIRNRIVSGLSAGVIVIEGKATSGSTITANLAKDQGKEVFCLPGNVDNPLSTASHKLIREGARLITCGADVLVDLAIENPEKFTETIYSESSMESKKEEALSKLTDDQRAIAEALNPSKPMNVDEICYKTGIEIPVVNQCLFMLEIQKIVKQLPGKQYILIV